MHSRKRLNLVLGLFCGALISLLTILRSDQNYNNGKILMLFYYHLIITLDNITEGVAKLFLNSKMSWISTSFEKENMLLTMKDTI